MKQKSIPWKNVKQLLEDGCDLIYLMREGSLKFSWEEWMEAFSNELNATYKAYREQRLEQKKRRKKINFFLALILTKMERLDALLANKNRSDEAEEEIRAKLECLKDYVKHAIIINEGRIDDETGQSITGSAD